MLSKKQLLVPKLRKEPFWLFKKTQMIISNSTLYSPVGGIINSISWIFFFTPLIKLQSKFACPQIRGLLTQIVAFPGWVIFDQLNIWTFQNPNGSLHVICFFCFPCIKCTVSHFLQQFLTILVQFASKKSLSNPHVKNIKVKVSKKVTKCKKLKL